MYEINARFLDEARLRFFGDEARIARLSLIDERGERYVRMANLACVGSHAINGVAELHSRAAEAGRAARTSHELWPEKFSNKTNGVTPRRWMALANPRLAAPHHRSDRRRLAHGSRAGCASSSRFADDADLPHPLARDQALQQARLRRVSRASAPASRIDPDSMFDVQVKRIHEYKRQHLNILHVVALYRRLKSGRELRHAAAHVHLRRQGGARLSPRETDDQADHLGGRGGEPRPAGARPAEGACSCRTST